MSGGDSQSVNIDMPTPTGDEPPDRWERAHCKSVMTEPCLMPCVSRLCLTCRDDVLKTGDTICPRCSTQYGDPPDLKTIKSALGLADNCVRTGCSHECLSVNTKGQEKMVDCPFHEFGCRQEKSAPEQMSGHMQREGRSHMELFGAAVANISRGLETAKWGAGASSWEVEILRRELAHKDEQYRAMIKQLKSEVESIRENRAIKETMELKPGASGSSHDGWGTELELAKGEPAPTGRADKRSMEAESVKGQLEQSRGVPQVPAQADASLDEWAIDGALDAKNWSGRESDCFSGTARPYQFRLEATNIVGAAGAMSVYLLVLAGPSDAQLTWPFSGEVTVTVATRGSGGGGGSSKLTRNCRIARPPDKDCSCRHRDPFRFGHCQLRAAGMDLARGVSVSCLIVPDGAPWTVQPQHR